MKIGIIGAMDCEVDGLKEKINNIKTEKYSNNSFCCGQIYGKEVVVAKCGEGKVNAAVTAQTMILKYNPDIIINSGVAGGLHPNMKVFDIALAENVCQHDADSTPLGVELGYVFGINKVYIKTDDKLNNMIENAAKKVCNSKIFRGTIASGDQFIAGDEQRIRIKNNFNAIAAEMEGAAVGHVCDLNKKRFTVLRAISDSADSDGAMSFETFAVKAAEISINILLEFIKSI